MLSIDDKEYEVCSILNKMIDESNSHIIDFAYENEEETWNSDVLAWSEKEVKYRIKHHNEQVKHLLKCKDVGCKEYIRTLKTIPNKIDFILVKKREDFLQ